MNTRDIEMGCAFNNAQNAINDACNYSTVDGRAFSIDASDFSIESGAKNNFLPSVTGRRALVRVIIPVGAAGKSVRA